MNKIQNPQGISFPERYGSQEENFRNNQEGAGVLL